MEACTFSQIVGIFLYLADSAFCVRCWLAFLKRRQHRDNASQKRNNFFPKIFEKLKNTIADDNEL